MPLFQNSIVPKYLNSQNIAQLFENWEAYKNNFLNLKLQMYFESFAKDKQIDVMVYELYGLSNEEIEIVENN
jgi:hypothetical protein